MLECATLRRGEDGRRSRWGLLVEIPKLGEVLPSRWVRSGSMTDDRTGDEGGNASSSGFRGTRTLLGEPDGLSGRRSWGDKRMWPELLEAKPGMDWVRDMGGARLATDRERPWPPPPERGDAVRGRYGRVVMGVQDGVLGEAGLGSVLRRWFGGFWGASRSSLGMVLGVLRRSEGTGEDLNASMRSVSGTGSMSARGERHVGWIEAFGAVGDGLVADSGWEVGKREWERNAANAT